MVPLSPSVSFKLDLLKKSLTSNARCWSDRDITTARERGGLIGILEAVSCRFSSTERFTKSQVRMMGQSIGPVFGGIISNYLSFHAIFWFLFRLGSLTLLLILLLPETLRSIAGNGTIRLTSIH